MTCQELIELAYRAACDRAAARFNEHYTSSLPLTQEWLDVTKLLQEEALGLHLLGARIRQG